MLGSWKMYFCTQIFDQQYYWWYRQKKVKIMRIRLSFLALLTAWRVLDQPANYKLKWRSEIDQWNRGNILCPLITTLPRPACNHWRCLETRDHTLVDIINFILSTKQWKNIIENYITLPQLELHCTQCTCSFEIRKIIFIQIKSNSLQCRHYLISVTTNEIHFN